MKDKIHMVMKDKIPGLGRARARPDLSPAIEKVRETCVKFRFWIKNLRFPLPFVIFSYGDLTFVGTSATECTFLLFHLKYVILYDAFIDV